MAKNQKPTSPDPANEDFRVRLIVDTEEIINAAVQLRASKQSVKEKRKVSKSEAVNQILMEALKTEIEEIRRYQAES